MTDTDLNQETLPAKEPMLNVPPMTFGLAVILLVMFTILQFPNYADSLVPLLSFVPADFGIAPLNKLYTVLSYGLLHFGWPHIIVNVSGLIAFGSGVERMLGKRRFSFIFLGGCIFGALGHWALFMNSSIALGGASAGVSALFGAVLPLIIKRKDLIFANIIFILTNFGLGQMGVSGEPDVSIAWQAHIFGFVFGEFVTFTVMTLALRKRAKRRQPAVSTTDAV